MFMYWRFRRESQWPFVRETRPGILSDAARDWDADWIRGAAEIFGQPRVFSNFLRGSPGQAFPRWVNNLQQSRYGQRTTLTPKIAFCGRVAGTGYLACRLNARQAMGRVRDGRFAGRGITPTP